MKHPKGNGKAEAQVRAQLQVAVANRDWPRVNEVFEQYGNYLSLIDRTQVGEARVFTLGGAPDQRA